MFVLMPAQVLVLVLVLVLESQVLDNNTVCFCRDISSDMLFHTLSLKYVSEKGHDPGARPIILKFLKSAKI